jgi:hypothetical protein
VGLFGSRGRGTPQEGVCGAAGEGRAAHSLEGRRKGRGRVAALALVSMTTCLCLCLGNCRVPVHDVGKQTPTDRVLALVQHGRH